MRGPPRHLRPKNFSRVYGVNTPAPGGLKLNMALTRLARPWSPVGEASTHVTRCMDSAPRKMTSEPVRICGTALIAVSGRGGGLVISMTPHGTRIPTGSPFCRIAEIGRGRPPFTASASDSDSVLRATIRTMALRLLPRELGTYSNTPPQSGCSRTRLQKKGELSKCQPIRSPTSYRLRWAAFIGSGERSSAPSRMSSSKNARSGSHR
mmetsp:Transcript_70432/g.196933  ORF Transcript_70432/g.196933 Transcript_70432/m.196933 type:complete len:208 (-) Transcript_70432:335-958(-)